MPPKRSISILENRYKDFFDIQTCSCFLLSLTILIYPIFIQNKIPLSSRYNLSIFFALTAIIIVIKLISFLLQKKSCFNFNLLDCFVTTYFIYVILSSKNLKQVYINDDMVKILSLFFIYYTFKTSFSNTRNIKIFLFLTIIIGIIVAIFGALQITNLIKSNNVFFSSTSFFRNPNIFTAYLTIIIPFALYFIINPSSDYKYAWLINITCKVFLGLAFFFIFYNFSRASIIVAILIVIYFVLQMNCFKIRKKPIIPAILIAICGASFLFYLIFKTKQDSTNGRILILKVSSQMISEFPLLGIGYGEYKNQYNNYQANYFKSKGNEIEKKLADETYVPFNELLKIVIETGVIGLAIFLGIVFLVIRSFNENKNKSLNIITKILILSLFSILFIGSVSYPFEEMAIYSYFFCLLGIISGLKTKHLYIISSKTTFFSFVIVSYIFLFVLITLRCIKINEWVKIGQTPISSKKALLKYERLYPFFYNNGYFQIDYAGRLVTSGYNRRGLIVLEAAKPNISNLPLYLQLGNAYKNINRFDLAEQSYLYACYMVPNKFISRYLLFDFYKNTQQKNKMINIGDEILKMPIKVPSMEVDAIKAKVAVDLAE